MNKKHSMSNVVSLTINGMNISHKLDKYAYKDGYATIGAIANERKVVESITDETVVIAEYLGEHKIGEIEVHADFSKYIDEKLAVGTEVDIKISETEQELDYVYRRRTVVYQAV